MLDCFRFLGVEGLVLVSLGGYELALEKLKEMGLQVLVRGDL